MAKASGYSSAEVKAGLFLTFCLALFVAMLFVYGKAARIWRGRQELKVVFTSVTSLRPDAPVRFNGVEVGRVKSIRILNLEPENVGRLPLLRRRDLDNLPLSEAEKLELRRLPQPKPGAAKAERDQRAQAFHAAVCEKLAERTMIELSLEVLNPRGQKGSVKRYRQDDTVRISTTLLGDTSVEISSGNGAPIDTNLDRFLLGQSGDFFSNLGKSIEQVKEILNSVNDLVGDEERQSIRKALRRFDSITLKIEKIVEIAEKRLPTTWDKVDLLADSAKKDLDAIGETVTGLQPKISKTLASADEAVKDLQERLGKLADEARTAVADVRTQIKPILRDVHYITDKSKDDFPRLVKNAKELAARLKRSADKLDTVLVTGDRLLSESYPDLRRLILAFRMGAENFEEATNLIKRKPWLMLKAPPKGTDLEKTQHTIRRMDLAMRRFRELNTELRALRRNMPNPPSKTQLERLDFLVQELGILTDTLEDAGDLMRKQVLPKFERKKQAFIKAPEAKEVSKR